MPSGCRASMNKKSSSENGGVGVGVGTDSVAGRESKESTVATESTSRRFSSGYGFRSSFGSTRSSFFGTKNLGFIPPRSLKHFSMYQSEATLDTTFRQLLPPSVLLECESRLYGRDKEVASMEECYRRWQTQTQALDADADAVADAIAADAAEEGKENETNNGGEAGGGGRTTQKKSELIWISGVSGCGKSTLALSLQDMVFHYPHEDNNSSSSSNTQKAGFYVCGKFNLKLVDEPYAGIVSACREICDEIMSYKCCDDNDDATPNDLFLEFQQQLILEMGAELPLLLQIIPVLEEITGKPPSHSSSTTTTNFVSSLDDTLEGGAISSSCSSSSTASHSKQQQQQQSAEECKNRFNYAFRRFVRVIGSFGPLVMVLDDLQWADLGSLELLEVLITDRDNPNLMIIGSYRSNEVGDGHPLAKTIRDLSSSSSRCESGGFRVTDIVLGNLAALDVNKLLVDLLSSEDEPTQTKALADICQTKTHGNAFFLLHYLGMLQQQKLLSFDVFHSKWKWDCAQIEERTGATSNVLDLVKSRMAAMPGRVRQVLVLASCLGSSFEDRMIRQLMTMELQLDNNTNNNDPVEEPAKDAQEAKEETEIEQVEAEDDDTDVLQIAVDNGFFERLGQYKYRWIHDQIQEAAYSLLSPEELASFQFRVGDALATKVLTEHELDAAIFVVVTLLNAGYNHHDNKSFFGATDLERRRKLAEMNLQATRKAFSLSAFNSATKFAKKGIDFLPSNRWDDECYDLTLALYSIAVDSEECIGDVESMDIHCNEIFKQTHRPIMDKARAYRAMQNRLGNHNRVPEAMDLCRSVLKQMGYAFPKRTLPAVVGTISGLLEYKKKAKTVTDEFTLELPLMKDPIKIEAMFFMSQLCKYAYVTESPLLPYTGLRMMKLTFQHGVCKHSPVSVASVGMMLTFFVGDLKAGKVYGDQAREILKKVKYSKSVEAHTIFMSCALVLHMTRPVHTLFKPLLRGYEIGLQVGDTEHAMANINYYILLAFQSGKPLPAIEADLRIYTAQIKEFGKGLLEIPLRLLWQVVLNLTGQSEHSCSFTGEAMDEDYFLKNLSHQKYYFNHYQGYQTYLYALFGHHERGADQAMTRGALHTLLPGSPVAVTDTFFRAISLLAMGRKTKKRKYIRPAKKCLATIKAWSQQGNPNVCHFQSFLEAEMAAYRGRSDVAEEKYQSTILVASRAGFVQDAAFANERYGEFLLYDVCDQQKAVYRLQAAVSLYREWGALRKVKLLERKYADVLMPPVQILVGESEDVSDSMTRGGDSSPLQS